MTDAGDQPLALSMFFVRGLVEAVESFGVSREELLHGSPVTLMALSEPLTLLESEPMDELVRRALTLTGTPDLGLAWWQTPTFSAFGAVGQALMVAQSFRAGMALIERYWPIYLSRPLVTVHEDGRTCKVRLHGGTCSPLPRRAFMEAATFAFCRFLRQCVGVEGTPLRICFDYPAPAYEARYHELAGCPVEFDSQVTEIVVSAEHAHRPNENHVPTLEQMLRAYADSLLATREKAPPSTPAPSLSSRVSQLLRESPQALRASMEDVGARLGMSERTLRRKLQQEGNPFPILVQQALREQAEQMLQDPRRSVKEVAFALGFADRSAFHRAVRRWTGKAPGELRGSADDPKSR